MMVYLQVQQQQQQHILVTHAGGGGQGAPSTGSATPGVDEQPQDLTPAQEQNNRWRKETMADASVWETDLVWKIDLAASDESVNGSVYR